MPCSSSGDRTLAANLQMDAAADGRGVIGNKRAMQSTAAIVMFEPVIGTRPLPRMAFLDQGTRLFMGQTESSMGLVHVEESHFSTE